MHLEIDHPTAGLSIELIRSSMPVDPEHTDAYDRFVLAGLRVMFESDTHPVMLQQLARSQPMAERLGHGAAWLALLMHMGSPATLPAQYLIPAALELMAHAVDFAERAGMGPVSEADMAEAVTMITDTILRRTGVERRPTNQQSDQGN